MRFWKHWPYWLRGGVIGGGVAFVWGSFIYGCNWFIGSENFLCLPLLFFSPVFPVAELLDYVYSTYAFYFPFDLLIFSTIIWFIVGVLIGVIVGNRESRKEPAQ